MQIIPSAVYRVGDRPKMTSRDEQNKRACCQPATGLAWPFLHACMRACVNGNGRRALTTSLETGHRLTAQLTERKGKNKIGAPAAAS